MGLRVLSLEMIGFEFRVHYRLGRGYGSLPQSDMLELLQYIQEGCTPASQRSCFPRFLQVVA